MGLQLSIMPKVDTTVPAAEGPRSPAEAIRANMRGGAPPAHFVGGVRHPAPYHRPLGVIGMPAEPELHSPTARDAANNAALAAMVPQIPQHVMRANIMQEQRRFQAQQ